MLANIILWGLPKPEREHRFHPVRRFRFDFAWPDKKLAVEVEGILFGEGGRHQRGMGYANDCHKYNLAIEAGWTVMRVPSIWLKGGYGEAMAVVEKVLREGLDESA